MAGNSFTLSSTGRFIRFIGHDDLEAGVLKLANGFIEEYRDLVPLDVSFILPNGEIYKGKYDRTEGCISFLNTLFDKYKKYCRLALLLSFKYSGVFLVSVMNDGRSEIRYDNRRLLLDETDVLNGINSKFYSLLIGETINGNVHVPKSYLERFGSKLSNKLTLKVNSGEVFEVLLKRSEKRIYGMLPIYKKKYITQFDTLMFTYRGDGNFDLSVFGEGGIEKRFELPVTEMVSDSETVEVDAGIADENANDEAAVDQDNHEAEISFDVIAAASHVDGRSHGMYIPRNVNPRNREWNVGENVILRTNNGDCMVSLLNSGYRPRLSSGWNQFVRAIDIRQNDTMHFVLVEDDENGVIFSVEKL